MKLKVIMISIIVLSFAILGEAQDINFQPRSLAKDCKKLWEVDGVDLKECIVPDSLYHDLLLDKGKIFTISSDGQSIGYTYVGRIYSCRSGGCGIDPGEQVISIDEDYEYFDYFIIFNEQLSVQKIRVYNYQATHGHEVGGKGWLKQFIGYQGKEKLEYGKNIDSISGATISGNAITYNVQESCRFLDILKPLLERRNSNHKVMVSN